MAASKAWKQETAPKSFPLSFPLSEMFGYATDLRSKTQGRGNYSMEVDHYEEVPKNIAEAIVAKNKGTAE